MKTQLKLALAALFAATFTASVCKAQPGLGTASARSKFLVDSLKITDPDEQKVLELYDDCITEYLNQWKTLIVNKNSVTAADRTNIEKKFQARAKEIQPSIDRLRTKFGGNYAEAMKFAQYSQYEAQRLMVVYTKYQKEFLKSYGH